VLAVEDTDGDRLPDSARVIADGLTLPNGLDYHDGALLISGGANLYRWQNGTLETLIDDLPSGAGFWTGSVVATAERFYIATGGCQVCDDPLRGAVLSYALDGTDMQVLTTGLRAPVGLALHDGVLWSADSAADTLNGLSLVEQNSTTLTFPIGSQPTMLAAYTGDALPTLAGTVLVILRGTPDALDLPGYAVAAVQFNPDGTPSGYRVIVPEDANATRYTLKELSYRTSGFWPQQPIGIAVSPEGWVYISVSGGRIIAIRPRA
jgi:hypothetical protein